MLPRGVHIRGVPDHVLAALKRRAAANHRSVQGELRAILEQAAKEAPPEHPLPGIELVEVETSEGSTWSRDEIYGDDGR